MAPWLPGEDLIAHVGAGLIGAIMYRMRVHLCICAWRAGKPAQVTYWVNEMSAALKALDPNHMVRISCQHRMCVPPFFLDTPQAVHFSADFFLISSCCKMTLLAYQQMSA